MDSVERDAVSHGKLQARLAGRAAAQAKWPAEVREIKKGVMQGYRSPGFAEADIPNLLAVAQGSWGLADSEGDAGV